MDLLLVSQEGTVFHVPQSARSRWDLFDDIEEATTASDTPIPIPYPAEEVAEWLRLDEAMCGTSVDCAVSYEVVERAARFMSPKLTTVAAGVVARWPLYCVVEDKRGHNEVGMVLRSGPPFFGSLPSHPFHPFHHALGIEYDPVYEVEDKTALLGCEWLNVATSLVYQCVKKHGDVLCYHFDWSRVHTLIGSRWRWFIKVGTHDLDVRTTRALTLEHDCLPHFDCYALAGLGHPDHVFLGTDGEVLRGFTQEEALFIFNQTNKMMLCYTRPLWGRHQVHSQPQLANTVGSEMATCFGFGPLCSLRPKFGEMYNDSTPRTVAQCIDPMGSLASLAVSHHDVFSNFFGRNSTRYHSLRPLVERLGEQLGTRALDLLCYSMQYYLSCVPHDKKAHRFVQLALNYIEKHGHQGDATQLPIKY